MEGISENNKNKENLIGGEMKKKDAALLGALLGILIGFIVIPQDYIVKSAAVIALALIFAVIGYNWKTLKRVIK